MKKLIYLVVLVPLLILLGCTGESEPASTDAQPAEATDGILVENAFYYTHINGHAKETETVAFVLFEYEQLASVRYQVSYIACTCRGPEVNFYSVAYVELSKDDGSIQFISYDQDSSDHYTVGLYGDSILTYEGVPAKDKFAVFQKEVLNGASQDAINAIEPMHGEIDGYTGATVTPNNAVRMLQGLFEYHNERYM